MTGAELRKLRKSLHLTQQEMAAELQVTFGTYNGWEHRANLTRMGDLIVEKFLRERKEKEGKIENQNP